MAGPLLLNRCRTRSSSMSHASQLWSKGILWKGYLFRRQTSNSKTFGPAAKTCRALRLVLSFCCAGVNQAGRAVGVRSQADSSPVGKGNDFLAEMLQCARAKELDIRDDRGFGFGPWPTLHAHTSHFVRNRLTAGNVAAKVPSPKLNVELRLEPMGPCQYAHIQLMKS